MPNEEVKVLDRRGPEAEGCHGRAKRLALISLAGDARTFKYTPGLRRTMAQILVAVTGASGVAYARRLLEVLGDRADVILSEDAEPVIRLETGMTPEAFVKGAGRVHRGADLAAPPASGSHLFDALVVVPCSGTTLAKIATGLADNLITRATSVALKEHRTLILVPRETPVSAIHLENLLTLARLGVVVLPASPGFYGRPTRVEDLVDFVVGRILDHLGVKHELGPRWSGPPEP